MIDTDLALYLAAIGLTVGIAAVAFALITRPARKETR